MYGEENELSSSIKELPLGNQESIKTLGISWLPSKDKFNFNINLPLQKTISTKKIIVSEASKFFDPLGLATSVIVSVKILMKKLQLYGVE